MFKHVIIFPVALLLAYLTVAFSCWAVNPGDWSFDGRSVAIVLASFFYAVISIFPNLESHL